MEDMYTKTNKLLGEENTEILKKSCVAIIGLGGVGSFAAEAIARCGVGKMIIADRDTIEQSNINRQLYAMNSTVGMLKTEIAEKRILDINPDCKIKAYPFRVSSATLDTVFSGKCDYIIDAIDSSDDKIELIKYAKKNAIPIISSMGTANRLDITKLAVADIYATSDCPFAKTMRKKCRENNIGFLKTVFSSELPIVRAEKPAACVFVPAAAGMLLASEAIADLTEIRSKKLFKA